MSKAFAVAGCAADKPASATIIAVEIVRKPPDQVGSAVHPPQWVVERFFAWISRNRRLWKDPEGPSLPKPLPEERLRNSSEADEPGSGGLKATGGLLAAATVCLHLVGDLLSFDQVAHSGALDSGDVDENVLAAVIRLDEAKALGFVEPLNGADGHRYSVSI